MAMPAKLSLSYPEAQMDRAMIAVSICWLEGRLAMRAPIVQRIERGFPKAQMEVRFLLGVFAGICQC